MIMRGIGKFVYATLLISILIFVVACVGGMKEEEIVLPPDELPGGFKASGTEPTEPTEGFWVDFEIYTIDQITPKIDYLKIAFEFEGETYYFYLPKVDDNIQGATLFKRWIYFPQNFEDEGKEILFDIVRPDSVKASLYGYRAFWWCVNTTKVYNEAFYATRKYSENSERKFLMRIVVREWEDQPLDRNITITGDVEFEVDVPEIPIEVYIAACRKTWGIDSGGTSSFSYSDMEVKDLSISEGRITANATGLRYLDCEAEKEIDSFEYVDLVISKEFFSYSKFYPSVNRENLCDVMSDNVYLGELRIWVNRFIYFEYEISENGVFTNDTRYASSNSVNVWEEDLQNPSDIVNFYRYVDFDQDGENDIYFSQYSDGLYIESENAQEFYKIDSESLNFEDITDYESAKNYGSEIYKSDLPKEWREDWEGCQIFILKTSSGKYVKMRIYKIHPMTYDEIMYYYYQIKAYHCSGYIQFK